MSARLDLQALNRAKKTCRSRLRACARSLPPAYFTEAGAAISQWVMAHPLYQKARHILAFSPLPREADIRPLLDDIVASKTLYLPRVDPSQVGQMSAVRMQALSERVVGAYGILEPGADQEACQPGELDLVLAPCLGASRQGERIGKGGGYYDRFLSEYEGPALLLCPECFLLEQVPVGPKDFIFFEGVVSEKGIYRAGRLL